MSESQDQPRKYGKSVFKDGLEEWIDSEFVPRPYTWMQDLEAKAKEDRFPVLSPASGAVLAFLVSSWRPKWILELGTGYGVSLVWMLTGAPSETRIESVDREELFSATAWEYLERIENAGERIRLQTGECLEFVGPFLDVGSPEDSSFVFVDCDKVRYPEVFTLLLQKGKGRRLRAVFDNVLWHGRISDPVNQAPSDLAVRKLWTQVKESSLPFTLFPAGDGLLCIDFSE